MNSSLQLWIEPTAWTLLHSLWQAAAIAILARAIVAAVRCRSASFAATVQALAMAAVFVAAAITFTAKLKPQRASPPSATAPAAPAPLLELAANPLTAAPAQPAVPSSLLLPLVAAWAIGVALMSLRLIAGALWLRRLRHSALPWADEAWQAKFRHWLNDLGIRRAVRLCTTLAHETPAVIGHSKPVVLLPVALIARLTPEQLEAVILHELMHIRRHDYLLNLLRIAAETIFFFNPAVWWISRAIRIEREVACDQLVAEHTGNKVGYAKTLLRLEELHLAESGGLALAANSGPLKTRIARLLALDRPAPAFAAWTGLACLALLLAGLAAFGLPRTVAADATAAREQSIYLERVLEQLKILEGKRTLRDTLTVVYPDALLDRLLGDLSRAEQTLAQLNTDFSDEHPEVMKVKALFKVINGQIEDRVGSIMKGLEIKVSSAKAMVSELEEKNPRKIKDPELNPPATRTPRRAE